jgi:hypothetical protein
MAVVTIDSYSESNQNSVYGILYGTGESTRAVGQSFTADSLSLTSCKFYLQKVGNPTGNLYARLYEHTGVFGTSSLPTGSALAVSDALDASSLDTSLALEELFFTGDNQYSLVGETKYIITIDARETTSDNNNRISVGIDGSSPTHSGNLCALGFDGVTEEWSGWNDYDTIFYVYGEEIFPIVGKKYPLPPFRRS